MTYTPRRKIGPVERAARTDLKAFPPEVAKGAIAAAILDLARDVDENVLSARDKAAAIREIRLCMVELRTMAPPGAEDDELDKQRKRREARLRREGLVADQ